MARHTAAAAASRRFRKVAWAVPAIVLGLAAVASKQSSPVHAFTLRVVPLTFDGPGVANLFPQASPDGRYIVYQRCNTPTVVQSPTGKNVYTFHEDESDWNIYRLPTSGGEPVRLTDSPDVEDEPTYSPDGRTIAFRLVRNGRSDLFLMDPDGRNKRPLVDDPKTDEKTPAFSADGRRVVFYGNRAAKKKWNLFTVDVATRELEQLTHGRYEDKHPQFTPDGKEIIFHSNREGTRIPVGNHGKQMTLMNIHSLTLDTGEIRPLYTGEGDELQDSRHSFLSPDGRFIVYHAQTYGTNRQHPDSYRRLHEDIYVMTRDGQHRVNLTEHDRRFFKHPSWSADGHSIYCAYNESRTGDVWNIASIDVTSALRELTEASTQAQPAKLTSSRAPARSRGPRQ